MDVIVRQKFSCSPERLWRAITNREEMVKWYFENIPDFKAELNFRTSFKVYSDGRLFTHIWEICEVDKPQKIAYTWKYKEHQGNAVVHFAIEENTEGCELEVMTVGLENFPKDVDEFTYDSCFAGWQYFIQQRLFEYIEN